MPNAGQPFILPDEILTKLKTVDGAGSGLDADLLDGKEASVFPEKLTSTITVTVGSGGDFATINDALEYLVENYLPIYTKTSHGVNAIINLLSGFTMEEQVLVKFLDLSWIDIMAEDVLVPVSRAALTDTYGGYEYAFCCICGGKLPRIRTTFSMDTSGTDSSQCGIIVAEGGEAQILPGKGFRDATLHNIYITKNSKVLMEDAYFGYAGGIGVYVSQNCVVDARGVEIAHSGSHGVLVEHSSLVNLYEASIAESNDNGVFVRGGSYVQARASYINICGNNAFEARDGAIINAAACTLASITNLAFSVSGGGIIIASNTSGSTSQTANTITSDGLIIQ